MNLNKLEQTLTTESSVQDFLGCTIEVNDIVLYTTGALYSTLRQGVVQHINLDNTIYIDNCKTKVYSKNTVIINKLLEQAGFDCQAFVKNTQTMLKTNKHCYLFYAIHKEQTGLLFLKSQYQGMNFLLQEFRDLNEKYPDIILIPFSNHFDSFLMFNDLYQLKTYSEYNLLHKNLLENTNYYELVKQNPQSSLKLTHAFFENKQKGSQIFNYSLNNLTKISCSIINKLNADIIYNTIIPIEFNKCEDKTYLDLNNVSFSTDFLKINMMPKDFESAFAYFNNYIQVYKILLNELNNKIEYKRLAQYRFLNSKYNWINQLNI